MFGFVFHDRNGQNHGEKWKIQWFFLERNSHGHPLARLLWERCSRKFQWNLDGKGYRIEFVHRKQVLFLSVHVDDINTTGKKQKMAPVWKKMMKNVDIDEPTSFLTMYTWDVRECNTV